jgi:hypothetical protein
MVDKLALMERLRAEGRWAEAEAFKNTAIKEFKAKGVENPVEAGWEAMATAYPPPPIAEPAESAAEEGLIDALLDRGGDRQTHDLTRDILWTYENLMNRQATPETAPGLGAWSLLQWARGARNRFFEQLLPKAQAARESEVEDLERDREERKSIAEIETILQDLRRQSEEQFERELLADVPGAVVAKVHGILTDWCGRFSVAISPEAQQSLKAHLAGLVGDCFQAASRVPT